MAMRYFAQLMWRGDRDEKSHAQFIVLVRLAMKEGGRAVRYVLCRYTMPYLDSEEGWSEIVCIKPKKIMRAVKQLWPSGGLQSAEFPKCDERRWKKASNWLADVAIECQSFEDWVPVYRLGPWNIEKKPSTATVGTRSDPQSEHLIAKSVARANRERMSLWQQLSALQGRNGAGKIVISRENMPAYFAILRKIAELNHSSNSVIRKGSQSGLLFLRPIGRISGRVARVLTAH